MLICCRFLHNFLLGLLYVVDLLNLSNCCRFVAYKLLNKLYGIQQIHNKSSANRNSWGWTLHNYMRTNSTLRSIVAQIRQKFLYRYIVPVADFHVIRVVVVDEPVEIVERASRLIDICDACWPGAIQVSTMLRSYDSCSVPSTRYKVAIAEFHRTGKWRTENN